MIYCTQYNNNKHILKFPHIQIPLIASNCVVWNDFCTIFDLIYWECIDELFEKMALIETEQHMQNKIISWWIEK